MKNKIKNILKYLILLLINCANRSTRISVFNICSVIPIVRSKLYRYLPQILNIELMPIFYNVESGRGDRLQDIRIYKGDKYNYRCGLNGFDKSYSGTLLVWRNNQSNINRILDLKLSYRKKIKIGFATRSWHFLNPVCDLMSSCTEFDIIRYDINLSDERLINKGIISKNKSNYYRKQAFSSLEEDNKISIDMQNELKDEVFESFKSSDIYFIDWLNHNTIWAISNLPKNKPLIVRVHSYEIFSYFAPLINYGRIDVLIFISAGIRDIFVDMWGWLVPDNCRIELLSNLRDSNRFSLNNTTPVSVRKKTLAMVQYADQVKDFSFALRVFINLYKKDDSFRLVLAGKTLKQNNSYDDKIKIMLDQLPEGVVRELGYIDNLSAIYNEAGFILSTSVREGSHESVIEGMYHGCIPVIRNWPLLAAVEGAKSAFPGCPILNNEEEFVVYILESSYDFVNLSEKYKSMSNEFYSEKRGEDYKKLLKNLIEADSSTNRNTF